MLGRFALALAIALLAHSRTLVDVKSVSAQACSSVTKQNCINHVTNALNCNYNFTSNVCGPAPTTDVCQSKSTASTCTSAGCYWDTSIGNCLKSLSQINSVYPCSYWTTQNNCQNHGCAYDFLTSPVCQDVTKQGANSDNKTSSVLLSQVNFSTPQMSSNFVFTVNISAPFQYTTATRLSPKFPVIQVLPAISGSNGPGGVRNASEQVTQCSTFQLDSYTEPIPNPPSGFSDALVQASLEISIAANGVLTPASGSLRYLYLQQFGYPRNDSLVKRVAFDSAAKSIQYQVSLNLTQALLQCGGARGASSAITSTGVTYTLPISYVEHGIGGSFVQLTRVFTIAVLTTGQISIGATAAYHYETTQVEVTYPQATCPIGQALQRISQNVVVSDVFDPNLVVSPVSQSNIVLRAPNSPAGPVNCYGDTVTQYTFLGCNRATFQCSFSFTTQSKCRTLTEDGLAFSKCAGAQASDRISDLGSDIPYSTALDGLHKTYIYFKECIGASCTNTSQLPNSSPDEFRSFVSTPVFTATSLSANPFQVQGGFLPIPTADANQFKQLTDQPLTPSGVNTFDGNVFSRQPVTISIFMPASQRSDYDLRLLTNPGNTTFYPLDDNGARVLTSVPASLDFNDVKNLVLYTTKNAAAQCAAGDTCNTLPACNGLPGCDGFSIPVSQLVALMPANGYGFSVAYRVIVPGTPSSGTSRRLLSLPTLEQDASLASRLGQSVRRALLQTTGTGASAGPNEAPSTGNVYFRIRINSDGSITVEQVSTLEHSRTAAEAFAMSLAIIALSSAVLYLFTASAQLSCTRAHTSSRK